MNILITTSHSLLLVNVENGSVNVIDRGRGLYYGIAHSDEAIYVAARGRHITTKAERATETGSILKFDHELRLVAELRAPFPLRDLHQIVFIEGKLWMTCAYDDCVTIFDGQTWEQWRPVPKTDPEADQFHFNSLYFHGQDIYLLAHNNGVSDVWQFRMPDRTLQRRIALGEFAHNIWLEGDAIFTCNSGRGRIESSDGRQITVGGFPRGIAITDEHVLVGISETVERSQRDFTSSTILVLNREWQPVREIRLPHEGLVLEIRAPGFEDRCYPHCVGRKLELNPAEVISLPIHIPGQPVRQQRPTPTDAAPQPAPPALFRASLPPQEVEAILRRIDENLALRPLLANELSPSTVNGVDLPPPPGVPEAPNLQWHVEEVKRRDAPFFFTGGTGLARWVRRLLNLPIKVFGRKQAYFNREILAALSQMAAQLTHLRRQAEYQAQLYEGLQKATARLASLEQRLMESSQAQAAPLEQIRLEAQEQARQLQQLAELQHGQSRWLEQVAADQKGQHQWLDVLARKHQMLALDVREKLAVEITSAGTRLPEPRLVDEHDYRRKIAQMAGHIRVNLGCGEKPLPGYLNVDLRPLPEVDILADVRRLPFDRGALAEIASAHLVEHFREHQLRTVILPYWLDLLKPGGRVRIICPNWAAMLARLNSGQMSLADFKLVTFGGQDYEGDDHFAMYTPEALTQLLQAVGFSRVEVVTEERMNGLCPEMELVAYC
jgi:predicted SAM-dependent methyltransferase